MKINFLDTILLLIVTYHLVISPFTKVEESFNIQAIHDILNYGIFPQQIILENYDHIQFPGVVPRTFIGSLIISGIAKFFLFFNRLLGIDYFEGSQLELQMLVRAILGTLNIVSLIYLRQSLRINNKKIVGTWYMILLYSQFHLLYYSSRTLPNFIALPFVNYSLGKILTGDLSGIVWLAFTGIVFRLEVGVFAGIIGVVSVLFGQSKLVHNLVYLVTGTLIGGLLSLAVDSYFWGNLTIPELQSFIFNVIKGKSSEWGVEPFGAYFTKYIFQLFRPPVILLLCFPGLNYRTLPNDNHPSKNSLLVLFISSILYILTMSFQSHKEWRFIAYVIPIFTLQAANGLTNISTRWSGNILNKILLFFMIIGIAISTIISLQIGYISSFNYPGGHALQYTNNYILHNNLTDINVHIDVPGCMTGVTRFGELHNFGIAYDKSENLTSVDEFDLVITHDKLDWEILQSIDTFIGINFNTLMKVLAKKDSVLSLFKSSVSEFVEGKFETLLALLRSTIVIGEYLHVYKRPEAKA